MFEDASILLLTIVLPKTQALPALHQCVMLRVPSDRRGELQSMLQAPDILAAISLCLDSGEGDACEMLSRWFLEQAGIPVEAALIDTIGYYICSEGEARPMSLERR